MQSKMSDRLLFRLCVALTAFVGAAALAQTAAPPVSKPATAGDLEFFEKRIRPVLAERCLECHGNGKTKGGLSLDTRGSVLKGGASGPAVVLGKPAESLLIQVLRQTHSRIKMPPTGKLPDAVIADFEKWVALSLPDPRETSAPKPSPAAQSWEATVAARRNWWSLKPVRRPVVPRVKSATLNPIDAFIRHKLQARGLAPAAPADRYILIRRAHLVLTGLPPTPPEMAEAVNDRTPGWYEKLVDRLLASPHYGERWARHWMDVVRYGETHGYEWNYEVKGAWRYRDYLIRALNQDLPYDQFVREHIAGDLLPNQRWNKAERLNESAIATAFYRFGEVGHDDFKEIGYDVIDNQIDTLSKAFQAATIACARCHDHKLDAVSARDYYALVGILTSSRQMIQTLDAPEVNAEVRSALRGRKPAIREELATIWLNEYTSIPQYLRAAQAAKDKAADAARLALGLDAGRLKKLTSALEAKEISLENPLHAWVAAAGTKDGIEPAWNSLGQKYAAENKQRIEFNRKNFTPFADFPRGDLSGWRADGMGLADGPSKSGDFALSADPDTTVTGILPAGLFSHTLSERLNGALRSPFLPKGKSISLRIIGGRSGMLRTIPDFRQLADYNQEIKRDQPGWVRIAQNERNDRNYVELLTKADNPRAVERGAKNKTEDTRSYFGILQAVLSDTGETPREELNHLLPLFEGAGPKTRDEAAARYAEISRRALEAWKRDSAGGEQALWLDWLLRVGLLSNAPAASPRLKELVTAYRETEKKLSEPRVVVGMGDLGDSMDHVVYVRGDYKNIGETVPRRYVNAFCGPGARWNGTGSGRLDLALTLSSPTNPLTARVMVNRVWHHLFGSGIVRTVDDFGHLGDLPSHPELLDWLAAEFMSPGVQAIGRSGIRARPWSVKSLIRLIVTSDTFKAGSRPSADLAVKDPENRLLQHFPARRLDAEAIRDSILAASGRMDRTMFGESIDPYREKPNPERKLISGPLDGNGRRSIYTRITLMELPKFLTVFNLPDAKAAQGKRDVTNVPAQALALLNDPFVTNQADFWGKKLAAETDPSIAARVRRMFRTAVSRLAEPAEISRFESLAMQLADLNSVPPDEILKSAAIWKDIAHAVFNLKEFVYIR